MLNINEFNFRHIPGFEHQWGKELAYYNFTQLPNALLNCQGHLELTDGELLTFIHLTSFKFHNYSEVFPSIETLSKFSCNGYSTVQKRLKSLEDKGMIKRKRRINSSNVYDLTPSITKITKHLKNCPSKPRIFSKPPFESEGSDPSDITYKEDQLNIPTSKNNTTLSRPRVIFGDNDGE